MRQALAVDVIDLFFAEYVSPADKLQDVLGDGGAIDEIRKWKNEGRVRYVGATAHSRPLSLSLIQERTDPGADAPVQYGAPEVGGEPCFPRPSKRACRWSHLPVRAGDRCSRGMPTGGDRSPSAADCYRFVLQHPAVCSGTDRTGQRRPVCGRISRADGTSRTGSRRNVGLEGVRRPRIWRRRRCI